MSWILIQICAANVLWQLGASSALFLNSQPDAGSRAFLQLTTPSSSVPEEERDARQTLVLNSRGRSVSAETPRARLRVRLPRKTEAQEGSEAARFSQFPAVAPLESMKAPAERDPLAPLTRQSRQNQGNFALARQNQAPGFSSQPSFLNNAPNRNNFRNRPRQFGGFNSGFNSNFNSGFNQNQQFRNTNQQRPQQQFESNRQSQSNNNFAPQGFRQSNFANPQTSSFPNNGQNTVRRPSVPAVRTTTQAVPTTTTTITTTTPTTPTTTTTPPPTTTTTTSTTTTTFPVSVSVVPQTRQPRVLVSSPAPFRPSTFRPTNLFSNQRGREGRAGHADHDAGYGGYQAPEPVYHQPPQYGKQPHYKILKMTGLDTAPIPEFNYMFKTENKINVMGQGELRTICDEEVSVMRGSYDYYGPDGKVYKVDWYADETGFHPSAEHLPKSVEPNHPEVAAAVAAQLEYAASQHRARRAAGYSAPPPCPPKYVQPAPQYNPPPPSYTPS